MTDENDERMMVARISRTMAMRPSQTTSRVIGSTSERSDAAAGGSAPVTGGRGRGCETLMRHLS